MKKIWQLLKNKVFQIETFCFFVKVKLKYFFAFKQKKEVHIRFINPTLGLDETKLLPDGVIQFPEFVFFGDLGATLELWCDTGTGSDRKSTRLNSSHRL